MHNVAFAHDNYFTHEALDLYTITQDEANRVAQMIADQIEFNSFEELNGREVSMTSCSLRPLFRAGMAAKNIVNSKGISIKSYFGEQIEDDKYAGMEFEVEKYALAFAEATGIDLNEIEAKAKATAAERKQIADVEGPKFWAELEAMMNFS